MAISSIGVGSGLPVDQLLEDLRKVENAPLALLESKATTYQSRLTAYGTIKSSIEALKTASDALGKSETFGALKTSVNTDAFTATASNKAIAGQYSVNITQLATSQTLTSGGYADRKEQLADGSVKITVTLQNNESKEFTLSRDQATMEGLVKAINADAKLGVSATMVNDGSGTPHRLLITAKDTGTQAAVKDITVAAGDTGGATDFSKLQNLIGFGAGAPAGGSGLAVTAANNAQLSINGIDITSQSNTIEDAIEGVTLTLGKETEAGKTNTLSITRDDTVTSKAITTFVNAYNNLQGIIKTLTSYDVDSQKGSALTGDSLARRVQTQIRSALNPVAASGAIANLSQMGITTDPASGNLKIDDKKLAAALKDNMADVEKLFSGENGISSRMGAVATEFTKSGGIIANAADSISQTLKDLGKQYDAATLRIDAKMESYRKQFSALDTMMAQMNSVSSYLTQQLAMLNKLSSDSTDK